MTQGKTLNNNEVEFAAAHAVDGDLSTVSATETDDGAGWIKLQLDKTYLIHKVIIYYRFYVNWYRPSEVCVQSEYTYQHCMNDDNNVDVSVYQGDVKQKSCGTLQLTYGLEQSDQIYRLLCYAKGDNVMLGKETGNIAVYEVAITKADAGITGFIF